AGQAYPGGARHRVAPPVQGPRAAVGLSYSERLVVLAARQRLRRRADFAATIRRGRRAAHGALVVHLNAASAPDPSSGVLAGFVVSRAVGGAVVRNAVKRRLRDLVAQRLNRLPAGTNLGVRALPTAASRRYS